MRPSFFRLDMSGRLLQRLPKLLLVLLHARITALPTIAFVFALARRQPFGELADV